jgi:HEXXH motif-containing protein
VKKGSDPFFIQSQTPPPVPGPVACWRNEIEALGRLIAVSRRAGRPGSATWSRLVEHVAEEGILAELAPRGSIPRDFPARVARLAEKRLEALRRRRPALPTKGSPEVGEVLVERGLAVVPGGRDPRFERRVARALDLLASGFPEGAALVRSRMWRVVPVAEWATVSYSSAREPGVAYINVLSAPAVRLAEDLLHESVHMRVHEIERAGPLVTAAGRDELFYSAWRREWRPLRGLLHAVCTFTAGAMFFARMGALEFPPSRRRWLARRLLEERTSVAMALGIVRGAAARGLLTREGRRLLTAATIAHRRLASSAARRAAWLARTVEGRREIARVNRLAATLRRRPVRWGWR